MDKIKRIHQGCLFMLAFFLLGACANPLEKDGVSEQEEVIEEPKVNREANQTDVRRPMSGEGLEHLALEVTLDDALEVFFNHLDNKNVHLYSITLGAEKEQYLYEIKAWDDKASYQMEVDAINASIIDYEKKEASNQTAQLDIESAISPLEAMEVALENSGSGYVKQWELKEVKGQMIYELTIAEGSNQKVNALTARPL